MSTPMYEKLNGYELIRLIQADDELAFSEVFSRYQPLLFHFAYKRIKNQEEAKDIVQDVFVKLWNNRKDFELKVSLSAYLFRSVLNRILNVFKHQVIKEEYLHFFQQMIEDTAQEADYRIREKDIEKVIEMEISALPPKMRTVFEMRKKEFLSNKQIAEKLGISEQTVSTHMKRALKLLRIRLGFTLYLLYLFL